MMTFDEWLNEPTASGEPRYAGIRDFVGPACYPGVEKLLADIYDIAYEAALNNLDNGEL